MIYMGDLGCEGAGEHLSWIRCLEWLLLSVPDVLPAYMYATGNHHMFVVFDVERVPRTG